MTPESSNPYQSPATVARPVVVAQGPSLVKAVLTAIWAGLVAYVAYTVLRTTTYAIFRGVPWTEVEWVRGLWLASVIAGAELLAVPIFQLERSFLRRVIISAVMILVVGAAMLGLEGWILAGHERQSSFEETLNWLSILWWSALPLHLALMMTLRYLLVASLPPELPEPESGPEEPVDPE